MERTRVWRGAGAGHVCAMSRRDLRHVVRALESPTPPLSHAGLFPSLEQLEAYVSALRRRLSSSSSSPQRGRIGGGRRLRELGGGGGGGGAESADVPFSVALRTFVDVARVDDLYFVCDADDAVRVAAALDALPLSPPVRYALVTAPIDPDDAIVMAAARRFASALAGCGPVPLSLSPPREVPADARELAYTESVHAVCARAHAHVRAGTARLSLMRCPGGPPPPRGRGGR
jgi:hypothetical protein